MFGHLYDYVVWNSCNVCTSQCAVGYVDRVADACCDDLGVDAGYVEDLNDFTDQINAAGADVIESSKEWGNISCTCSCSQKCLVCGEDQGLKSRPSFAIRDGLVVTPQITPMSFAFLMSSTFAVSMKNLMLFFLPYSYFRKVSGPVVFRRTAPFFCYLQYRYVWFFRQVGLTFIN